MKAVKSHIPLILIISMLCAAGCSTTKRLAEDETLYTGVRKIKIESATDEKVPGSVKSAVEDPLKVKPNNPLYSPYIRTPLPIGLWVWNYMYTEKNRGLKAWIYRRLAKQPVLMSQVQPDLRTELVKDILDNHGYFGSSASYEIIEQKNPKKNRVSYFVTVPEAWYLSKVAYPDSVSRVTAIINSLQESSNVVPESQYNVDTLRRERVRITNYLRNNSYYYFRPEYLEYEADTFAQRHKVDLRMIMSDGIPTDALRPYDTGKIRVAIYNPEGGEADSLHYDGFDLWYNTPLKVRKGVLARRLKVAEGEPVRVDDINTTLTNLTKLGIFRYVNLNVTPLDSLAGSDVIDMDITASLDVPMEAEFEVDFSSKSNSFIGPGATFSVRHKNIFHGGEVLSVKLNGAYEWQTGNRSSAANSTSINSYEFGANVTLTFPRLVAPHFMKRSEQWDTKTTVFVGASILNRPRFFTLASYNGYLSYDFQTSPYSYHNLTLFKMVYNKLLKTTEEFRQVMEDNPSIALSFQNQFIPMASYTYTFDKRYGRMKLDRLIWQSTVSTAGNILAGVYGAVGSHTPKKIFGNPFSQFVKGVTELKYYHNVGRHNTLASRLLTGAGYAYGNSTVLPYSEQFYIGGANSIRAFTIRSLGPGSYHPSNDANYGYFDQTGEFTLEANLEFRFGIMNRLGGAVFLDAGNIWLLRKDESRPGGLLHFKKMWDQIALGTGVGVRYDITYLVIRADLGIGIHAPYKTTRKGYYNIPRFKDGLGFHLAIGYPF